MDTFNIELLLVIAVISAITECVKRISMSRFTHLASFMAIILGITYVSLGKYFFAMYIDTNWLNTVVLGLGLGLAATGGYENIKNIITISTTGKLK